MLEQMQTLKKRCPLDTYLIAVDGLTEENLEARMRHFWHGWTNAEQKTKMICCLRPKASMPAQAAK